MTVRIKRIYDPAAAGDGYGVLAPSDELRRWFGHRPERFEEFQRRYAEELRGSADHIADLRRRSREGTVTLVFAARDAAHGNAAALAPIVRRGFPRNR
jgi:uncharacterized protein YeaO (DUF488 family)